jgi:hypothetical protein
MELFLRVIADTADNVIRDVRIKGSATLLELHENLYPAFGLNPGEMGSFFYSTPDWDQGEEIPMFSLNDGDVSMENTTVASLMERTHHALYVYNFMDMNIFYVEFTKSEDEEGFEPFVVLNAVGELAVKPSADALPGLAGKDPSEMTQEEIDAMFGLDALDELEDEDENDPFSDFEDGYDSYDQDYF